jgi:hypothetical protein
VTSYNILIVFLSSDIHLVIIPRCAISSFKQDDLNLQSLDFVHAQGVEENVDEYKAPFEDGIVAVCSFDFVNFVLYEKVDERDEERVEEGCRIFAEG